MAQCSEHDLVEMTENSQNALDRSEKVACILI